MSEVPDEFQNSRWIIPGSMDDLRLQYKMPQIWVKGGSATAFESLLGSDIVNAGYLQGSNYIYFVYDTFNWYEVNSQLYTKNNAITKEMYFKFHGQNGLKFGRIEMERSGYFYGWNAEIFIVEGQDFDGALTQYGIDEKKVLHVGEYYSLDCIPYPYKEAYTSLFFIKVANSHE
mmetsp:Transcript_33210/g.40832  ORF Transcript_33210/g.40832 Transcript_33210/m.40832 type:complete len:174 (+) Transcript_33210:28-549(+)